MKDLKEIVACVLDYGLFVENAVQLSETYKHIFYYNPSWKNSFPSSKDLTIGEGFDNITVIKDFWDYKKYFDLCIFPDIYQGDLQEELKSQGIPTWGMGKLERLERDRFYARDWQREMGLPTQKTDKIIGVEGLKKLPKDSHIKLSEYRDDAESFKQLGNPQMNTFFDSLNLMMGHKKETYEFMVEEHIEGIEPGVDIYTVDGRYPSIGMFGFEVKDCCYGGKMARVDNFPPPLKKVDDALKELFTQARTRGQFSTEVKIDKKRQGYLLDFTARLGYPPAQGQMEIIGNLPEIIWNGANGILTEPKIKARYMVEVMMSSDFAPKGELAFEFPEKIRKFVKIANVSKHEGIYYYIPNKNSKAESVGAVIGLGNTLEEAMEHCKKNAEQVKAFQLEIDIGSLDKLKEETEKAKSFGINF